MYNQNPSGLFCDHIAYAPFSVLLLSHRACSSLCAIAFLLLLFFALPFSLRRKMHPACFCFSLSLPWAACASSPTPYGKHFSPCQYWLIRFPASPLFSLNSFHSLLYKWKDYCRPSPKFLHKQH